MLAVVLLIDALEACMSRSSCAEERKRLSGTLDRLDKLLARCLAERFARRDSLVDSARRSLDEARRRVQRAAPGQRRLQEVLAEISAVLTRLNGWWAATAGGG